MKLLITKTKTEIDWVCSYVPEVRWYTCTFITHRASIIRWPKAKQRTARGTSAARPHRYRICVPWWSRRFTAGWLHAFTSACSLPLLHLRGAIARPSCCRWPLWARRPRRRTASVARAVLLWGTRSTAGCLPCPVACRDARPPSLLVLPLLRRGFRGEK